jgi:hypothetical protein
MNRKPTVVMVHGAWAGGSSWQQVIRLLQADRVAAIAAPIPRTTSRRLTESSSEPAARSYLRLTPMLAQ